MKIYILRSSKPYTKNFIYISDKPYRYDSDMEKYVYPSKGCNSHVIKAPVHKDLFDYLFNLLPNAEEPIEIEL